MVHPFHTCIALHLFGEFQRAAESFNPLQKAKEERYQAFGGKCVVNTYCMDDLALSFQEIVIIQRIKVVEDHACPFYSLVAHTIVANTMIREETNLCFLIWSCIRQHNSGENYCCRLPRGGQKGCPQKRPRAWVFALHFFPAIVAAAFSWCAVAASRGQSRPSRSRADPQ